MSGKDLINALRKEPLWPSELKLLRYLADEEGDGEVVYERGAGWWAGTEQISGRVVMRLNRRCLLHREADGGVMDRYTLNADGCATLALGQCPEIKP